MKKLSLFLSALLLSTTVLAGCSSGDDKTAGGQTTVKIGIFKNVTHAAGYVALDQGYFQKQFGDDVKIEVQGFDNGSDFSTALSTEQIDIGFVGPGPSTNQFVKSKNFRVISGSNNGGAVLVAGKDSGVNSVQDLKGKTVAIPTKGSTNEISLRLLLEENGLKVTTDDTGVQIIARAPADTLLAMRQGEVDATLIPEPWGTQMANEGIGQILVDWDQIPPNNGNYPLTIMVANDKFLKEHRDLAKKAIAANIQGIEFIKANPEAAYTSINNQLKQLSGKGLDVEQIKAALAHCNLTSDVSVEAIEQMAQVSIDAGYIKGIKKEELDLKPFVDLTLLDEVKKEAK